MKQIVSITANACKRLKYLANTNNTNYIYFYVKGGGCNGFNYHFEPSNDIPEKKDEVIPRDDYNLVVTSESILHLLGTTVDWKKTIMGESFHFENPMAQAKCGCGTSFTSKHK
tara:strand:- start:202 stop:540 length:339 start_codon:yes stop_codon:yes gene_type:complete